VTEAQKRKRAKHKARKKIQKAQEKIIVVPTYVKTINHHYDTTDGNIEIYDQSSGISTIRHYKKSR